MVKRDFFTQLKLESKYLEKDFFSFCISDEQVALVNFELDVPPALEYLPHQIPVQVLDKDVMAEAQFLAQQRKYWPSGFL